MYRNALISLLIPLFFIVFNSCTATHYFKTPNDVYRTEGTVVMEDGTERKGLITVLFENGTDIRNQVMQFTPAGSTIAEDIAITKISYYTINGSIYYPKYLNLYTSGTNHLLFVKRLSAAGSKIQLFELHQKYKSNNTGEETVYYFITLPGSAKYETIELTSDKLVPNFDIKMSGMVADCPDLVQKIKSKKPAYNYSLVSFGPKKIEVMKRIISEYNSCR